MSLDTLTLCIFLSFWPVWLAWELFLIWRRRQPGPKLKLISMVARDRGWQLSSVVYTWNGLAAHFWWTGDTYATVWGSVLFWAIGVMLLVEDVVLWNRPVVTWPKWLRFQRWPLAIMALGLLAGHFLFPQIGLTP